MKNGRLGFIILITAIIVCPVLISGEPTPAFGQTSPGKVLMIPREGYSQDLDLMISMEVNVMTGLLTNAGFVVDIATSSGSSIVGPTQKIEKVLRLSQVNVNEYAGVLMPCMAVGLFPGPPVAPEAIAVVKKALAEGKPVASALGSTIVLAEGGVLKGRKYAFIADPLNENRLRSIGASGTIAGLHARTDAARGVWKAPESNAIWPACAGDRFKS